MLRATRPVTSYPSFRDFLRDVLECERTSRGTGQARLAEELGISPALLSLLLKGKRVLSLPLLHKIATYLRMSSDERDCFETMVLLEQSTTEDEKRHFKARLKKLMGSPAAKVVRRAATSLVEYSEIPVVLVYLLDVVPPQDRLAWLRDGAVLAEKHVRTLARATGATPTELSRLLDKIRTDGILSVNDDESTHVRFDALSSRRHQIRHVSAMIRSLAQRMETIYAKPDSLARTFTFSMSHEGLASLVEQVRGVFHQAIDRGTERGKDVGPRCIVEAAVVINPAMNIG